MKTATKYRFLGSIPGCVELACCDVGEAILEDGSKVTTTWGRNLIKREAELLEAQHGVETVTLGSQDHYEVILASKAAAMLRPMLLNTLLPGWYGAQVDGSIPSASENVNTAAAEIRSVTHEIAFARRIKILL